MSMAASSSSSWKYDVFLNFRGEDTRKIFVGHLYRALDQKAINTFIDAEELRKGNDLSELLAAIEESRLSIVVFSQNYASSTWCLKELVKILACMDAKKQIVVPIFYEVDPSEVRKQKKSFAEAFAQHESESNADMEELESWRSALTRAANLSGWDSRKYEDDAKLIEEIVDDIFKRWIQVSSSKDNDLVGMDYHMDEMNSLLRPGVNDVFTVGIWGMGGIGKTTIARAVYDDIACQFEACCFLENVKEGFSKNGAVHMQEVLLSRILKEKERSLGTLDRGSRVIMERLQRKKVFIVLDDVDELSQIEALLGKQHSFGGGSRVIITTRDKQLLSGAGALYKPQNLSEPEALKLFNQYAFRTIQPTRNYGQLSRRAIQYAQGLPLALKVLGALLHNKTVRQWEDVFEKIRKIPQSGIHNVLKTSFDGLDDSEQQDIFLDIACFLKGMDIDSATKILDSFGFHPHDGIGVLIDRALISVSDEGELEMHDLLEEMGREIVRQECIKEPGGRSRLWSYEDVRHMLTQKTATEAVEGIILDSAIFKEGCSNTEAFVSMTKLRLLMIRDGYLDEYGFVSEDSFDNQTSSEAEEELPFVDSFDHRAPHDCFIKRWIADLKFQCFQLRCLIWRGCPLKSWPSNFQFKNLVNLDMSNSCIEQLWKGAEPLEKLKFIDLSYCEDLEKTPDFTKATSLEELNLQGCTRLYEVDPSISALKNLAVLNLRYCRALKSLPSSIHMGSLQTLYLSYCLNLEKFPEISDVMEKLTELHLDGTAIKELPSSINKLTGLLILDLSGCRELKSLPSSIHMGSLHTLNLSGCSNLEKFPEISDVMEKLTELYLDGTTIKELPSSINKLTGLPTLDLRGCRELKSLPSSIHMGSLQTLNLSRCSNLEKFPEISDVMEKLTELHLDGTAIKELPSSINKLTGLTILDLEGCRELKSLPSSIHMGSLRTLRLCGCSNLEKFPEISDVMEKLTQLHLNGTAIKELPSSINKLTGLTILDLQGCRELKSLPSSIHMGSLQTLDLSGCSNLEKFPEISDVMEKLSQLYLNGTAIKELPSSINKLTGLPTLDLRGCRELKCLPSSIHMGSLQTLNLSGCSNLEKFPEISDVMEKLTELRLYGTAIKELPSSINKLTGLTILDLEGCEELKSLPSSIHMGSLRTLRLCGCSNLEKFPEISDVMEKLTQLHLNGTAIKELPSSINKLTGLTILDLQGCRELKSLPSSIHMGSLQTLDLSGCSKLEKFPEISDVMEKLTELHLCWTAIKELPSSINKLTGLTILDLQGCRELKSLPSSIHMGSLRTLRLSGCSNLEKFPEISDVMEKLTELHLCWTAIKELPSSINKLTGLTILDLQGCRELKSLPSSIHMGSLQTLDLYGCSNLEKFPEISDVMEKLTQLHLNGTAIKELPSSINKLTGLTILDLQGCRELKSLPSSIHMGSLQTLDLSGCSNLEKFPEISDVMEKLTELRLCWTAIKELPSSINKLTGVTILDLQGCRELKSLPSSIHMGSLRTLRLSGCSNLEKFPEISDVMEKLSQVYLNGTAIKELPSSIRNLPRLVSPNLSNCKSLGSLPDDICNLVSLCTLDLSGCSKLQNLPEKLGNLESLWNLEVEGSGIKQLPLSLLRLNKLTRLSCRGCKEMTAPFSSWSTSMEDCSHRGRVHLDLSDCNLLELSGIAHLSSLKELDLSRNNFESLPAEMNRLHRLTDLKLEGCKRLKSIPELSSSISFIDAHDCTALESVSRPKLLDRNVYFTFSNCFQLVQNLFEEIVEAHQGNLQPLSLFMHLPGSKLSDWFSHQCSGSSVTVHLRPVSDHKISGFAVCGVTKFKYAHYTYHLSALCFCTLRGEHGERSFRFDLLDWITFSSTLNVPSGDRLLESDHMFMGYLPLKIGVLLSERYTTEATFRVELKDSGPPVQQHRIRRCGVRLFYANHEEVHNQSMTQPDFHHENFEAQLRALRRAQVGFARPNKRNHEGCCYNEAEQSGGETPDAEDLQSKRLVLPDGAKEN